MILYFIDTLYIDTFAIKTWSNNNNNKLKVTSSQNIGFQYHYKKTGESPTD